MGWIDYVVIQEVAVRNKYINIVKSLHMGRTRSDLLDGGKEPSISIVSFMRIGFVNMRMKPLMRLLKKFWAPKPMPMAGTARVRMLSAVCLPLQEPTG